MQIAILLCLVLKCMSSFIGEFRVTGLDLKLYIEEFRFYIWEWTNQNTVLHIKETKSLLCLQKPFVVKFKFLPAVKQKLDLSY